MTYADYIRSLSCSIPGCPNKSILAHQRILGGGGTSKRPPDTHAVPLCDKHHKEEHMGSISFWLNYFPEYTVQGLKKDMVQLLILKIILKNITGYIRIKRFMKDEMEKINGERDNTMLGKFSVSLFDGTDDGGLWIEDTLTGEGAQFHGPNMENAIQNLFNEHF